MMKERITMNSYRLFILMFNALDFIYDKKPNRELGNYLSGLNPFLFEGENSAIICEYEEFREKFHKMFSKNVDDAMQAFEFCLDFIKKSNVKQAIKAFDNFDKNQWISVFNEISNK